MAVYLIRTRAGRLYELLENAGVWMINFKGEKKKITGLGDNGQLEKGGRIYFQLKEGKVMRTQPIVDIYEKVSK
ncbi:MAG: hypothetical protein ABIJ18_03755 [archaeon]